MNFLLKYKNILIGAVLLIIGFVIYSIFFAGSNAESDDLLTSTSGVTGSQEQTNLIGAEIINALNQIESLKLDPSIFSSPVFQSLRDKSQEIPPENVGKANPFDPIGAGGQRRANAPAPAEDTEPETGPRGTETIINTTPADRPAI